MFKESLFQTNFERMEVFSSSGPINMHLCFDPIVKIIDLFCYSGRDNQMHGITLSNAQDRPT